MNREEILNRLDELTSYMSFGRILSKFELIESVGLANQIERSQVSPEQRLMNSEMDFLAGLWLYNVKMANSFPIEEDIAVMDEILYLMNQLHLTYKPTPETPLNEQLKEIAFYEGDEAYDWQMTKYALSKYDDKRFRSILENERTYYVEYVESTFVKIKKKIEEQLKVGFGTKEYFENPMPLFTLSASFVNTELTNEERKIVEALSFKLGFDSALLVREIGDQNTFLLRPIVELPDNQGYFIIDVLALASSMNETPYYWIIESPNITQKQVGKIRGDISEQITYNILRKDFPEEAIKRNIVIRKTRKSNNITDIDLLLQMDKLCVIFQVKSKRLTELSKQGDANSINKDADAAITNAHRQGIKCIDCLNHKEDYFTLKDLANIENASFINVCITSENYPTISSMACLKSMLIEDNIPGVIAMSIYDLDSIFDLLMPEDIKSYFQFRLECANYRIYGINEMYYLGAFIANYLEGYISLSQGYIPREYAVLVDDIIKHVNQGDWHIKGLEEISMYFEKNPPANPIQCQ